MKQLYNTITTFLFLLIGPCLLAQAYDYGKMSQSLINAVDTSPETFQSIHIVLNEQVDHVSLDLELRKNRASASERAATVIRALRETANGAQGRLLGVLKNSEFAKKETIGSAWIVNALFAEAKKELIAELSHDAQVQWIGLNGHLQMEEAETVAAPPFLEPNDIERGLAAINAPALWEMGYTGYGQVAMTSDTGIDPTHPALAYQYYGHYVPAEQTWVRFQQNGNIFNSFQPFDNGDHGTHVTGTTLGLDRMTNDTIGVAFNARWIGACTLCGIATNDNIWAFEWAMNPDGDSTTVDDMPDVINNSWFDSQFENDEECFSIYRPVFEALETAGIAVVFSAGNGGPDASTITPPKNININEVNVFCVGNLNGNSPALTIAEGSSIGPSYCPATDTSLVIKPEVSAPGTAVRSCVPGGNYELKTGTSMAAPHVSGAILLLKEAFPEATGKDLKLALYHSCTDLGIPGEDNTYGMGIINVMAAFNWMVEQGFTPVSPHKANDIMLVNVANKEYYCNGEVSPIITAENAGSDTIHSFLIFYKTDGQLAQIEWTGQLVPRERTEVILPAVPANSGPNTLSVSLDMPNGTADERPLNNRFSTEIFVTDRPNFRSEVQGPDFSACLNTTALIRGILPTDLQGKGATMDISWYTDAVGGTIVGSGELFETPPIQQDETFYADVEYTVPLGPKDPYFGNSSILDSLGLGMQFEVTHDIVLENVTVYREATGGSIIWLADQSGDIIEQKVLFTTQTGELEVPLGWSLGPGTYSILLGSGKRMAYTSENAAYPYTINDVVSITGTTDGQGVNGVYYFFYNWQVSFKEPCGRSPVTVLAGPEGTSPDVDITASADTINIDDQEAVNFTSISPEATQWYWDFGDGTVSNEENPSHTYVAIGEYLISLTVVNANGCKGFAHHTVVVNESNVLSTPPPPVFDTVMVFPNPVRDYLSVAVDLPVSKNLTLRLADYTGRIWHLQEHFTNSSTLEMDVRAIPPGVYFLLVETDAGNSVWKVVKM